LRTSLSCSNPASRRPGGTNESFRAFRHCPSTLHGVAEGAKRLRATAEAAAMHCHNPLRLAPRPDNEIIRPDKRPDPLVRLCPASDSFPGLEDRRQGSAEAVTHPPKIQMAPKTTVICGLLPLNKSSINNDMNMHSDRENMRQMAWCSLMR